MLHTLKFKNEMSSFYANIAANMADISKSQQTCLKQYAKHQSHEVTQYNKVKYFPYALGGEAEWHCWAKSVFSEKTRSTKKIMLRLE